MPNPPLVLPPAPAAQKKQAVKAWRQAVEIATYAPAAPDKNPMFLEHRVYQGSSGAVYPLPFVDRIAEHPVMQEWDAVHVENDVIRVMILPQLGGRIHIGLDKTNGYDFFYRQNVIKPALVGLAGTWCSGGVEFNWPQHHRPGTAMTVNIDIERHADGAVTVWCSDHDPLQRLKGMHGVRIRPGSSAVEVHARLHNRTNEPHTFLWWANVATRVHDHYQSFFPTDVTHVADHAKRATTTFPLATSHYYGVDYAERGKQVSADGVRGNDLTWYRNIQVPTSYMIVGSQQDFFGGYDHAAQAGLVHVADHRIAPGKKQWTWGDHPFGHAWDRLLTDDDGPYIELMAGVFTDNQPDFSYLMPGETRCFTQRWYPIQRIGTAQQANERAALHLTLENGEAHCGVAASEAFSAVITLEVAGRPLRTWKQKLAPGAALVERVKLPRKTAVKDVRLVVTSAGREVIAWGPGEVVPVAPPVSATEPAEPSAIATNDELYRTGTHLAQYRHATCSPLPYWQEAVRRDPEDTRCRTAIGWWHYRRGEFRQAIDHLQIAIQGLTRRNPNPADGEAHYCLGLALRAVGQLTDARESFAKAGWNRAWAGPAQRALAEMAGQRGEWTAACAAAREALRHMPEDVSTRSLLVAALRRAGEQRAADEVLRGSLALDRLDHWTRLLGQTERDHKLGKKLSGDAQAHLDVAFDCARAGLYDEALQALATAEPQAYDGVTPMLAYVRAWVHHARNQPGDALAMRRALVAARAANPDYCFPARLDEFAVLTWVTTVSPNDAQAHLFLGNWLYARRRHAEAIVSWELSVAGETSAGKKAVATTSSSVAWRNLGIAYHNVAHQPKKAKIAYDRAVAANPQDARLWFERDQLWKRLGVAPAVRLKALTQQSTLISQRDDLTIAVVLLWCQVGRHAEAETLLMSRRFQPWEGGEGQALGAYRRIQLAHGRQALAAGDAATAKQRFAAALEAPDSLGEAWHLLQNHSETWLALGDACAALGETTAARRWWREAAEFRGDFQGMSVQPFSEATVSSAWALQRLQRIREATALLTGLTAHATTLRTTTAKIPYFATSLPTMLLFDDDLTRRQHTQGLFLLAQAELANGRHASGKKHLRTVLERDPDHAEAAELLSQACK